MPAWLLNMLISLAFKIGMPLLLKKLPWLPKEIVPILEGAVGEAATASSKEEKKQVVREAKKRVRAARSRREPTVGAAPDLKRD